MYSLPGLQLDNVSSSGFVYHECSRFIRRNEFHRICGKSGSDGQEKSEEERDFHWMQGVSALDQKIGYGKMKNSLISRTCIMKPKRFPSFSDFDRCFICLRHFVGRSKRQK